VEGCFGGLESVGIHRDTAIIKTQMKIKTSKYSITRMFSSSFAKLLRMRCPVGWLQPPEFVIPIWNKKKIEIIYSYTVASKFVNNEVKRTFFYSFINNNKGKISSVSL
jgi:hypothetical protein